MGLFRRTPRARFPADMAGWLEKFGRYTLDIHNSGIDGMDVVMRFDAFREYADADPDGFLADLRGVVAGDTGFVAYGASCLVWQMISGCLWNSAALPLIETGLDFKLDRGLLPETFSADERTLLAQRRARPGG